MKHSFQGTALLARSTLFAAFLILVGCQASTSDAPESAFAPAITSLPDDLVRTVGELQKTALSGSGAWEFLEGLTVEVGPRLAGSDGDRRAVDWARAKLTDLGFSNVRAEAVEVPRWVRGSASGEILTPFPQPTVLVALGGSVGTNGPIEAEVFEVKDLQSAGDIVRSDVEGKIVFFSQRMRRTQNAAGYGETVGIRVAGPSLAAKLGAVAVLIRSVGTDNDRVGHTGTLRYSDDAPQIPAAALSNPDADVLVAQLERGESVTFRLDMDPRYEDNRWSANVIGEIPGREKPEEIVLLVAHLDSWDLGTGAIDDGAGCAIITEAARLISQLPTPPRRTLRVLLTANEEFGLSGARAYAEAYAEELDQHVAGFESDLGAGKVWAMRSRVADDKLSLMRDWAALLEPLGIEYQGNEARGGADLSPIRPQGVPVFDLPQDATLYFDLHHTANDTLDKVVPEELAQNVAAYASLIYLAAEMEEDLGRTPVETES